MKWEINIFRKIVNLKFVLWSLLIGIGAVIAFYVSTNDYFKAHVRLQITLQNLAGVTIASVALALLWELVGKRSFFDEILAKVNVSHDLKYSGIKRVYRSFQDIEEWKEYFRKAKHVDIFFAYGSTWRNNHLHEFRKLITSKNAHIRVVLPDPDDSKTMEELGKRFGYTAEELEKKVREAYKYFEDLSKLKKKTNVSVWYLSYVPHFTFYRFDDNIILAFYTHRTDRASVPAIICEREGQLFDFIDGDFNEMINGLARKVL